VEDEEPRLRVARRLERVHDLGRDVCPGFATDSVHAILEPKIDVSLDDEYRLGVSCVDVERRPSPAGSGAHLDHGELVEVREERHAQLRTAEDDLAFVDLEHGFAA
jgi:hypothetical protein